MESGKYAAIDVAHYVIDKCSRNGSPVSNLHLQKILYFLQKFWLKELKCPLFDDEIEAWPFGPVVPNVYYNYCSYGALKITEEYDDIPIYQDDYENIDKIVKDKSDYDPWNLVKETHKIGSAWHQTYNDGKGYKCIIDKELIMNEQ